MGGWGWGCGGGGGGLGTCCATSKPPADDVPKHNAAERACADAASSSSSGVYASPSTRTLSPGFTVPLKMRPNASKPLASLRGKSLQTYTTKGPRGLHARMCCTSSLSCGPARWSHVTLARAAPCAPNTSVHALWAVHPPDPPSHPPTRVAALHFDRGCRLARGQVPHLKRGAEGGERWGQRAASGTPVPGAACTHHAPACPRRQQRCQKSLCTPL